ncbi:MAG: hypothetical protein K2X93_27300 [Candidatus Obscuribacterales bacterium]|nr:hypothetical protein [Candidatus Obscuribacterales bacterium]
MSIAIACMLWSITCACGWAAEEQGKSAGSEVKTPNAAQVDNSVLKIREDPLAPTTILTGSLTKEELEGRVTINEDKKTLTLHLVNRGKRTLVFGGDNAEVLSRSRPQNAEDFDEVMSPPKKSEIVSDLVGVAGSILTNGAIPTAYDFGHVYQPDGAPFYGKDQDRRKLAERRFGQRTLFPGESTSGKLFLPNNCSTPATLSIPVYVHPSGESLGNLQLPISTVQ